MAVPLLLIRLGDGEAPVIPGVGKVTVSDLATAAITILDDSTATVTIDDVSTAIVTVSDDP